MPIREDLFDGVFSDLFGSVCSRCATAVTGTHYVLSNTGRSILCPLCFLKATKADQMACKQVVK